MAAPTSEARPLYELIHDVLREHLLDGSFPLGLVFGETTVGRAFGSSRIPAAAALRRLREEGLLRSFDGRGLIAADAPDGGLIRKELLQAGLRLPDAVMGNLEVRNHHGRIYPQVEHTVAAALAFGRFLVNETALAEHYGVSRTVAHEVLTRLARAGLIAQERNQRWCAGPLSTERMRDHVEMRWLLEPVALSQSMDGLDLGKVRERQGRIEKAMSQKFTPLRIEKLETELHVHTVLANASALIDTIRRSQLPVIPTHSSFAHQPHSEEIGKTLQEHFEIYDFVLKGNREGAMKALESHVRRALAPNMDRLRNIGPLPEALRQPFLVPGED